VAIGEQHITRSHVAFAAIPAQHSKLGRIQDRRTPRNRDQAIIAAAGRPRGSSRNSVPPAGCVGAHRNLLADRREYLVTQDGRGAAPSLVSCLLLIVAWSRGCAGICAGSSSLVTREAVSHSAIPLAPDVVRLLRDLAVARQC